MASAGHASKRRRTAQEGGSTQHFVLLPNEDYRDVHAREGRLRKVGANILTVPAERTTQKSSEQWKTATSWAPLDDSDFALDPDGVWYDEAVEGDVMQDAQATATTEPAKKKARSRVSKRPHVVWKELHRQSYVDEVLRSAGRGDFRNGTQCPDCLARRAPTPGPCEYRCRECFNPDLTCSACCVRRHRTHPLHRIEKWVDTHFVDVTLKTLGLKIQLGHASLTCETPTPCHQSMVVLHTNGIHEVTFNYCGCDRAVSHHIQLLRRRFYPASQLIVKTCASFDLLELLHKLALTTKASTYDFYRALEKMTDNTGIVTPKSRYRSLFRMIMQFRHLKLLMWGGRGHDPAGVGATAPGQLALRCPSCPYPGINLPDGWEKVPPDSRFLYMLFTCMDANFRLKNQLVSNYSQDPGLGIGWAYMVPREPYEKYVLSRTNDSDISTCVGLQALAQANNRYSHGLRYTGVGGTFCGRSEMILPLGIGNLQKGERYANMDYIFASAIRAYLLFCSLFHAYQLILILISYDIACQWFINLFKRMTEHWPDDLRIPSTTQLIPAIPKLHEPMHETTNHEVFSLNFIPGVGQSDLECPERVWSGHNALGNATRTQGPGSRQDVLDDHFSFWNWQKYVGLGKTLMRKYRSAVAERNIQREGHRGLTASLEHSVVQAWEGMCIAWEQDSFPKKERNPYHTEGLAITEAQAKKELAREEERHLGSGGIALHATSPGGFIAMGLDLEGTQRRLRRLAKGITTQATARQEGGLTEQRNQLMTRIRVWEQLLPLYAPGLLQYRTDLLANSQVLSTGYAEDTELWLPSRLPADRRNQIYLPNLPEIEKRLRYAQCHDALDNVRHTLKIKTRLIKFKNKNLRGQREGTRSRAIIDRVHGRARVAAEKYRAARVAMLALAGPGVWEEELRVLADSDIRGYQDPDLLCNRVGRSGTLEDGQVDVTSVNNPTETDDFTLFNEERTLRDGTGETRRTLSWIWRMNSHSDDPDAGSDEILRAEWAKSRARTARAQEEVLLLREEMRRTLEFLEWKAEWWFSQANLRSQVKDIAEGLRAYSHVQSQLQRNLAKHFREIWKRPLHDSNGPDIPATSTAPPTSTSPPPLTDDPSDVANDDNSNANDEDDEDDDDDDEDIEDYAVENDEDDDN